MSQNRRQELYDKIRETSKDELIISEMIRLGFWKSGEGQPAMSEDWIKRRGELTRELNALAAKQRKFKDREAMLHEIRHKRMKEAKARREETKLKREEERLKKAAIWRKSKEEDIVYLGEKVSKGLNHKKSDAALLSKFRLPAMNSAADLARAMGVSIGELRFLAFNRDVSKTTHYRQFLMPKKSGGDRLISAPMPRLKAAQHWILEQLLVQVPVHDAAHGFVRDRSILTNAQEHCGRDLVINLDLRDFFPTVSYPRVKGLFRKLGYSEQLATVLGLLCTEPEVDELEMDGETFYLSTSDRHLPQGAPTSPAITNLLCFRLDKRMTGVAASLGFHYTRYADDMSFSSLDPSALASIKKLLWRVRSVVEDEGFVLHPDKTRIMRRGSRQEVTGLTVNEKPAIPRRDFRRFRALLQQVEKDGPGGKHWRGGKSHLLASIRGYANFIRMVDAERGSNYVERAQQLLVKHGWSHEIAHPAKSPPQAGSASPPSLLAGTPPPLPGELAENPNGKKKRSSWFKFWRKN
ncbi:MAG: RNA-directed DNA polymerase [Verrucomicrobiales bacterium]|jgi:RNA-directed DNA polymerase